MATTTIECVDRDSAQLEQFLRVPEFVYRGDKNYCRQTTESVIASLWREQFLNRQHAFVAAKAGVPSARVVARISSELAGERSKPLGMLGFFESIDDPEISQSLLREAIEWLRSAGAGDIVGPMDGDTWHKYRLNNGPFDEPPFLMEPYNPPYYEQFLHDAGFMPDEKYHSKRVSDVTPIAKEFAPTHQQALERGYRLTPLDLERYDSELERLYRLSVAIFAGNRLYTDISWPDFRDMYLPVKKLLDPDFVWFAQSPDGEDVGFVFAIRDYHQALTAMRGSSSLLAKFRFWLHARSWNTMNIKSMGVLPEHRRSGLATALINQIYVNMLSGGYRTANLCLIHNDNPSDRLDAGHGQILRRYTLYKLQSTA